MDTYIVYIRVDSSNRVLEINSSAFLADTEGWTQIDEGWDDRYHHAQGNYLDGPLYDDNGIPRYKLDRGRVVERTEEEIAADLAAMPEPEPGPQEQMQAAVRLARMQAQSLPDVQALEVPELYDLWAADEDPIPAARGMEYQYGLYYLDPEDSHTYRCARTGEAEGGTVILQYLPHELVGQYFEEATV